MNKSSMSNDSVNNPQLLHELEAIVTQLDYRVKTMVVEKRKLVVATTPGSNSDGDVHLMLHWPTLSASSQVCRVSQRVARLIDTRCFEQDRPFFLARYAAGMHVAVTLRHDIPSMRSIVLAEHLRAMSIQNTLLQEAFCLYGIRAFEKWINGTLGGSATREIVA